MRFSFVVLGLGLVLSTAACSVTATNSEEDAPTFSASDVKPSIEGTWSGTANGKPVKVTLTYVAGGVKSQCSNRTLSEPGSVRYTCIDVSTLNLGGDITLDGATTVVNGQLLVMEKTFQNRGELSLQGATKTTTRLNAMLRDGKLEGSLALDDGASVDVTLTR